MNAAGPERVGLHGNRLSAKAEQFTESVIREMTRLAMQYGAINLAQGFPDFAAPAEIKGAAKGHRRGHQSVRHHLGREIVARRHRRKIRAHPGRDDRSGTRNHRLLRLHRSHDVRHDGHHQSGRRSGRLRAVLRKLRPRRDSFRRHAALREAASPPELDLRSATNWRALSARRPKPSSSTRRTIPRAKFSRATSSNRFAIFACAGTRSPSPTKFTSTSSTTAREHISMASLDGMRDRTITINGMSKTYSVTGWRVGWAIAPPEATDAIRKVHDFLTVGAAAPLQEAGRLALQLPESYYEKLARELSRAARPHARHPRQAPASAASSRAARTTS